MTMVAEARSRNGDHMASDVKNHTECLVRLNGSLPLLAHVTKCGNDVTSTPMTDVRIPRELTFTDDGLISVISYCILFVIAAVANLTVFIMLFKNRHRKSRVNLFIMNLSMADMIVTFVEMPLEVAWHITVSWDAGDLACRILMFFRVFGFYLSSFILVTISLDRYFAIVRPLSLTDADKRARIMLTLAWIFSFTSSIPQSVIFHVEQHPMFPWFKQCVTFNFFPTPTHELAYNLFNVTAMYLGPLILITVAYSLILHQMAKKSKESRDQWTGKFRHSRHVSSLRRSAVGRIERAKIRTLKMTIVIVAVFVTCWTPYFVISAWWWIDKNSAKNINPKIQRALFMFAVSNSCMNPIVYGTYSRTLCRELKKYLCWTWETLHEPSSSDTTQSSSTRHTDSVSELEAQRLMSNNVPVDTSITSGYSPQDGISTSCFISVLEKDPCRSRLKLPRKKACQLHRKTTPPYIAQGRGMRESFDKYFFI